MTLDLPSTASKLTSPVSQKSKDLNRVSLRLQDLEVIASKKYFIA